MSDRNDEQWEELSLAREKFIQALAKKIYTFTESHRPSAGCTELFYFRKLQ